MPPHAQVAPDDEERRLLATLEAVHAEVLAAEAELSNPTKLMSSQTYSLHVETLTALRLSRDESRHALRMHRHELEEIWGERAQAALSTYQKAKAVCSQAIADSKKPWSKDGQFAIIEALNVETVAREEYQRVLRIFNDLTADRKTPPLE